MKKITIITGHYGSGKTNLAVNLAVSEAGKGRSVSVVDLDIVNPYFRTADFSRLFHKSDIKLIAPDFANSNLDIPSLQFDLEQIAASEDRLIIDVGGDDAGAFALGRYAEALSAYGSELEMIYVINQRRYLTTTADEALALMYEIEATARLKHTAVVNNTNLGCETTPEIVAESAEFAAEVCEKSGLPLLFTACPEEFAEKMPENKRIFPVKVYVKPLWEKEE
ncbi:MAG: cobalamin biosynthesis protein CobQ [Ruminococcus sp.]|nr:cobalamin biosynthesis protein CobQ [Ruminococcus sp.]